MGSKVGVRSLLCVLFYGWDLHVSCMHNFTCLHVYLSANVLAIISSEWGALENTQV